MDPHFNEFLAAIAGMNDIYGGRDDDHPIEFHDDHAGVVVNEPAVTAAAA